mmetsp:Transcript_13674/g.20818  ORF Transcript_13674/g.20818 Transcript_13674/m.20818 type:complete len:89 (-) Transcript_13674:440-706(-)
MKRFSSIAHGRQTLPYLAMKILCLVQKEIEKKPPTIYNDDASCVLAPLDLRECLARPRHHAPTNKVTRHAVKICASCEWEMLTLRPFL